MLQQSKIRLCRASLFFTSNIYHPRISPPADKPNHEKALLKGFWVKWMLVFVLNIKSLSNGLNFSCALFSWTFAFYKKELQDTSIPSRSTYFPFGVPLFFSLIIFRHQSIKYFRRSLKNVSSNFHSFIQFHSFHSISFFYSIYSFIHSLVLSKSTETAYSLSWLSAFGKHLSSAPIVYL